MSPILNQNHLTPANLDCTSPRPKVLQYNVSFKHVLLQPQQMENDPEQHWLFHQNLPSWTPHGTVHEDSTWSGGDESLVKYQILQLQALQSNSCNTLTLNQEMGCEIRVSGDVTNALCDRIFGTPKKTPKKMGASSFSISACSRSQRFKKNTNKTQGVCCLAIPTGNGKNIKLSHRAFFRAISCHVNYDHQMVN